jgi:hypothetical protein
MSLAAFPVRVILPAFVPYGLPVNRADQGSPRLAWSAPEARICHSREDLLPIDVTRYVKPQSAQAAAQQDNPRARAVGFLMALYQRRLASSTRAMRKSLEKPPPTAWNAC